MAANNPFSNDAYLYHYYLEHNPDLGKAGIDTPEKAWAHYVTYGASEALAGASTRSPAPWFNIQSYRADNPDLQSLEPGQLFVHFLTWGISEMLDGAASRAPGADYRITDAELDTYARDNPDLQAAFNIDPAHITPAQYTQLALHFYEYGYNEGRPGAPFDIGTGDNGGDSGGGTAPAPPAFMLTPAIDHITGTAANDTVIGEVSSGSTPTTLQALDEIDGDGGIDTLKITTDGTVIPALDSTHIQNIEIIDIDSTHGINVDTSGLSGVNHLNMTAAGDIISATAATGAVTVATIGPAYQAGHSSTLGATAIYGGETVSVTQQASSDVSAAATDEHAGIVSEGAVTITANAATQSIAVAQDITALPINADPAHDTTGLMGIAAGVVNITGAESLAAVTVDGYGTNSQIRGTSNTALNAVQLSGGDDGSTFTIASAAPTLALTVVPSPTHDNNTVDVQAGTTTLNANIIQGFVTLQSASATSLNVTGRGIVIGTAGTGGLEAVTSISTEGLTGYASFTIDATQTTYTGGAGADNVALSTADAIVTQAIYLGAGDDLLDLNSITTASHLQDASVDGTGTPPDGYRFDGGAGDADVILLDAGTAQALSTDGNFATHITGFEQLALTDTARARGPVTIDMSNMGGIHYIIANGTSTAQDLTLNNLQGGATVQFNAADYAGRVWANMADASGATLNVALGGTGSISDLPLTVGDGVETLHITTQPYVTVNDQLTLTTSAAKTIDIDGASSLALVLDPAATAIETIDARGLTGSLTLNLGNGEADPAGIANQAVKVTGGRGDDELHASLGTHSFNDVLHGCAGNDTLFAGSNGAHLFGGAGNDTFEMNGDLNGDPTTYGNVAWDAFSIVEDFSTGDSLGLITGPHFEALSSSPTGSTLEDLINAAADQASAHTASVWFGLDGDTYVVAKNSLPGDDSGFVEGHTSVIELAGVDLSQTAHHLDGNAMLLGS